MGVPGFLYCTDKLQDVCKLKLVKLVGLTRIDCPDVMTQSFKQYITAYVKPLCSSITTELKWDNACVMDKNWQHQGATPVPQ